MPVAPLGSLPDSARLWVFAAERPLAPGEADALLGTVDDFLGVWAAHGRPLTSARELRESRFLLIAVDETAAGASGCSIAPWCGRPRLESGGVAWSTTAW